MATANVTVKTPINNIKTASTIPKPASTNSTVPSISTSTSTTTPTTNTLVDNIALHIKNKANSKLKYLLIATIPILLLLFYLLYNYNFNSRSAKVISSMNYKKQLNHTPLQQCYQQEKKYQFKLCDYYISSSYMTPCVGNQHYDYVSNDMIAEVLKSGARYIQLPICEADVTLKSLPVVGTAEYGNRIITSLNTLDIQSVLKTINGNAFTLNNKTTNYPLIIHLILNTTNSHTLSVLADSIQDIFGDVLINVPKYIDFPIYLEKLCNLLGKIIIIATPEYKGTNLEPFIVPTTNLFNIYHFSELTQLNVPQDTLLKTSYNNKLSEKQQGMSSKNFFNKYQDTQKGKGIDYIVKNADKIGETIMKDTELLNNLTSFNKVGVTVVKPHYTEDTVSKNYDTSEAIYFGCQLVCMNFQVNDIHMQNYLEIFKDSSFRLKPSSMRFTDVEEPITDLLALYKNIIVKDNNMLNDFYYKYNNTLISFESYTMSNTFLTQIESNLKFNLGSNAITNQSGLLTHKVGITQCFIVLKSTIGASDNISMYLQSASNPSLYLTLNNTTFTLQSLAENKKGLVNQAFYFVKPKTTDIEQSNKGLMVSIRTYDSTTPLYLTYQNKNLKASNDAPQIELHNNMTFFVNEVKSQTVIKMITLFDGSLISTESNLIGVLETNTTDGTAYNVMPIKKSGTNFNLYKDQFSLQNKKTNNYLSYDDSTGFLYDKYPNPNQNSIYNIVVSKGYYNIVNTKNQKLIVFNKNLIKFGDSVSSTDSLFKLDISYTLLN
jgi:hypothetical protein